ncbi:AAA family ATPase [Halovenus sp. HT40]|uniref:AAA family ATPase n=1 Tax=Halovenus sp. HT40 TaxID=3126691 RepID=UPI00300F3446
MPHDQSQSQRDEDAQSSPNQQRDAAQQNPSDEHGNPQHRREHDAARGHDRPRDAQQRRSSSVAIHQLDALITLSAGLLIGIGASYFGIALLILDGVIATSSWFAALLMSVLAVVGAGILYRVAELVSERITPLTSLPRGDLAIVGIGGVIGLTTAFTMAAYAHGQTGPTLQLVFSSFPTGSPSLLSTAGAAVALLIPCILFILQDATAGERAMKHHTQFVQQHAPVEGGDAIREQQPRRVLDKQGVDIASQDDAPRVDATMPDVLPFGENVEFQTPIKREESESAATPEQQASNGDGPGGQSNDTTGSQSSSSDSEPGSDASGRRNPSHQQPRDGEGNRTEQSARDGPANEQAGGEPGITANEFEYDWQTDPDHDFGDVGGLMDAKRELDEDVIKPLRTHQEEAEALGVTPSNIIFHGPPGTGKTFLAKALAAELKFPFVALSGGDVQSKWINESAEQVNALFSEAKQIAEVTGGAVIFLDELDTVLKDRTAVRSHAEDKKIVNEFLSHLEEATDHNIVFIGATNRADALDEAGTRSGRIDKKIEIGMPDQEQREAVLRAQLRDRQHELGERDIKGIAAHTDGLSAADLESLVNSAAKKALGRDKAVIAHQDLKDAFDEFEE